MRVLALTHGYPPTTAIGSWIATHRFLRHLAAQGHEVTAFAHRSRSKPYSHEGVTVETGIRGRSHAFRLADNADVLISHSGDPGLPAEVAQRSGLPHVRMIHGYHAPPPDVADLLVFNSQVMADHIDPDQPSVVCNPPVDPNEHRTTPGEAVTLVNCSRPKGIKTAWRAAERLPDVSFLGVRGGYGEQVVPRCDNFEVIDSVADMRQVWERTRILLAPSIAEAWGMTGVEAMASGIPVIAHPAPGLVESLGDAGIFVDRDDIDEWVAEITRLQDPDEYTAASQAARGRSDELDPTEALTRFTEAVEGLVKPDRSSVDHTQHENPETTEAADHRRPARVLAMMHGYPPHHNAGAEWMAHTLLRHLAQKGHSVHVWLSRNNRSVAAEPYDYQGVTVHPRAHPDELAQNADVIVTHLETTERATRQASVDRIPVVHLLHNDFDRSLRMAGDADLVVLNSDWMAAEFTAWCDRRGGRTPRAITIHPPVAADDYRCTPGEAVTLVNLFASKGSATFWAAAEAMPDVKFLAVTGGYGKQDVRDLPNVEVVDNVPGHEMAERVYSRTKILLMPSVYESWGRVGVEAMVCGIPVIAHPTAGLQESLGDAGTFVDRDDTDGWVDAIRKLLDGRRWPAASRRALRRAAELDPTEDLGRWAEEIAHLTRR